MYHNLIIFISVFFFISDLIFAKDYFEKIGESKIVYPKVLTRSETLRRLKRSSEDYKKLIPEYLYIVLDNWIIQTSSNSDVLLSPNFFVESKSLGSLKKTKSNLHKCLALQGHVHEFNNSRVILTLCGTDIYGLIMIDGKSYFLQPLKEESKNTSKKKLKHIIYETVLPVKLDSSMTTDADLNRVISFNKDRIKFHLVGRNYADNLLSKRVKRQGLLTMRKKHKNPKLSEAERAVRVSDGCRLHQRGKRALTICDTKEQYNMTRDLALPDYLEMIDPETSRRDFNPDDYEKKSADNEYGTFDGEEPQPGYSYEEMNTQGSRSERESDNFQKWIKITAGVDCDIIEFHGERAQQYVFTLFNIVSELFKHISDTFTIRIVVMRMLMYPDCKQSAIYAGEPRFLLFSVNKWNRRLLESSKEKHDMAVWITNYKISEDVSSSPGAFMCQAKWSCLLIEDVGWLSAIKIAHGIGHLVGLTHDGDLTFNNNCASESLLQTTIMSEVIPAVMPLPVWSSCSIKEFETAVKKYHCLDRPPGNFEHSLFSPGTFSLDAQCRIEFGDGWMFCSRIAVTDPCKELWCNKASGSRRSCMTRQTPTLDGTRCGRGKKCINHTCEDAQRPSPIGAINVELPEQGSPTRPPPYTGYPTQVPGDTSPPGYPQSKPPSYQPQQPGYQPGEPPNQQQPYQPGKPPNQQPPYQPGKPPSQQPSYQPAKPPSQQPPYQPGKPPSQQQPYQPAKPPSQQPPYQPVKPPSQEPPYPPAKPPSHQQPQGPSHQPPKPPSHQPSKPPSHQQPQAPVYQPGQPPQSPYQPAQQPIYQPSQQPIYSPGQQPFMTPGSQQQQQTNSNNMPSQNSQMQATRSSDYL